MKPFSSDRIARQNPTVSLCEADGEKARGSPTEAMNAAANAVLGIERVEAWPSTRLPPQPLQSLPSEPATASGSSSTAGTAPFRSTPGAMGQALQGALSGNVDRNTNFVQFSGGLRLVQTGVRGLDYTDEMNAFADAIVVELQGSLPAAWTPEWELRTRCVEAFAGTLVCAAREQHGDEVSLATFYAIYKQVTELKGKTADEIAEATARLRYRTFEQRLRALLTRLEGPEGMTGSIVQVDGMPHRLELPALAGFERGRKIPFIAAYTSALISGLMGEFDPRVRTGVAERSRVGTSPAEVEYLLCVLMPQGRTDNRILVQRLFAGLQASPSLCAIAIDHIKLVHETLSTERTAETADIEVAEAILLLHLHPDTLSKLTVTTQQVDRIAQKALWAIGSVGAACAALSRPDADIDISNLDHSHVESALTAFAHDVAADPKGKLIVDRMLASLRILWHTADRLAAFALRSEASMPEVNGRSTMSLLDEFVPPESVPIRQIHELPQRDAVSGMLTWHESVPADAGEGELAPANAMPALVADAREAVVLHAAPAALGTAGAQPPVRRIRTGRTWQTQVPRAAAETAPTQETTASAGPPPKPSFRQPGSRGKNADRHLHSRDLEALKKKEALARVATSRARDRGLIGTYDTWTEPTRDAVLEERALRQGLAGAHELKASHRLIPPPGLD